MVKLRVCADTHEKYQQHLKRIRDVDYSIHLGDWGFRNDVFNGLDYSCHIFLAGNHTNFDDYYTIPNFLPHGFGPYNHAGLDFFYLSGAFSIDWQYRVKMERAGKWPKTWWEEEQLSTLKLVNAIDLYSKIKPEVVFTHDCPASIVGQIVDNNSGFLESWGYDSKTFTTRTTEALEEMFKIHQPKLWIFGHYHVDKDITINGTRFICRRELGYTDLTIEDGKITSIKPR